LTDYLYITEFPYLGDVSPSTPREPATGVQRVEIGKVSEAMNKDTHLVMLYSTLPCRFVFFSGEHAPEEGGTPMQGEYEIQRTVHNGTAMRIATFAMKD